MRGRSYCTGTTVLSRTMVMQCKERDLLWQAYNDALTEFSGSADELSASLKKSNFAEKGRACQKANDNCKAARATWEKHVKEHAC